MQTLTQPLLRTSFLFALVWTIGTLAFTDAQAQQTHQYTLTSNQPPILVVDAGVDITVEPGEVVTLGGDPTAVGGTAPYVYMWTPDESLANNESANPEWTADVDDVTFLLTVRDAKNCTASDEVSVLIDLTTSVSENELPVTVYPNPVSNWLVVRSGVGTNKTLTLHDHNGKVLLKESSSSVEHRLDIRSLPGGLYILMLDNGVARNTIKVMIVR